jgi:hypothetical protein
VRVVGAGADLRERGDGGREQVQVRGRDALGQFGRARLEMVVEGVDKRTERQLLLELGGPARERGEAAPLGEFRELAEQPALAHSRVAAQRQEAELARPGLLHGVGERIQSVIPPDERAADACVHGGWFLSGGPSKGP